MSILYAYKNIPPCCPRMRTLNDNDRDGSEEVLIVRRCTCVCLMRARFIIFIIITKSGKLGESGGLENTVYDTGCSLAIGIWTPLILVLLLSMKLLLAFLKPGRRHVRRCCVCSSNAAFLSHQNIRTHEHEREAMYDILLSDKRYSDVDIILTLFKVRELNNRRK